MQTLRSCISRHARNPTGQLPLLQRPTTGTPNMLQLLAYKGPTGRFSLSYRRQVSTNILNLCTAQSNSNVPKAISAAAQRAPQRIPAQLLLPPTTTDAQLLLPPSSPRTRHAWPSCDGKAHSNMPLPMLACGLWRCSAATRRCIISAAPVPHQQQQLLLLRHLHGCWPMAAQLGPIVWPPHA